MSWYVKRVRVTEKFCAQWPNRGTVQFHEVGWVGPIRSAVQASKEANAWTEAGWSAAVFASTPEVRQQVRFWQKQADRRRAS